MALEWLLFLMVDASHNKHSILKEGTPMSLTGMRTHILSNGDRFHIDKKKVKVLPIEAPFI